MELQIKVMMKKGLKIQKARYSNPMELWQMEKHQKDSMRLGFAYHIFKLVAKQIERQTHWKIRSS